MVRHSSSSESTPEDVDSKLLRKQLLEVSAGRCLSQCLGISSSSWFQFPLGQIAADVYHFRDRCFVSYISQWQ